jgi:hypothetical protein
MSNGEVRVCACACGSVKFTIQPPYNWVGYCHCKSCRISHSAPMVLNIGLDSTSVSLTAGEEKLVTGKSSLGALDRMNCADCGTLIYNFMPEIGYIGAPLACLESVQQNNPEIPEDIKPMSHIFYAERICDMADGLPKYLDLPTESGGTGEILS